MRATTLAFTVGLWRDQQLRVWMNPSNTLISRVQEGLRRRPLPTNFCRRPPISMLPVTTTGRLLLSTFQSPEPPGTKGAPIFPDVDLTSKSSNNHSTQRNMNPNAVFVVTGASRGIGLQFCKTLFTRTKGTIVACCRSPTTATGLQSWISTTSDPNRIQIVQLDLEDQLSIDIAASEIQERFNRVDILLHVAGILGDGQTTPGPERSLSKINRDWFEKSLNINVIGPVMFSKALAPLWTTRSRTKQRIDTNSSSSPTSDSTRPRPAIVASISARVGSITDNSLGGWYSYRISKAALNQATRTMALEMKRHGVYCVSLHPGTTDTDLSRPFQSNVQDGRLFPVHFTVNQLMNVIDSLDEHHTGGFYDWAGKAISF